MRKQLPHKDLIHEVLSYDEKTGDLTWKMRTVEFGNSVGWTKQYVAAWNAKYAGSVVTHRLRNGYIGVTILGVGYFAHRIIWKMVTGLDPDHIDHVDGNKGNNRLSNLRDVSASENQKNRKLNSNNRSGVSGVHWCSTTNAWVARISVGGRKRIIGRFPSQSLAVAARLAEQKAQGFHHNHGRAMT
ncbi:HNH endonuclease protein [Rhizobium phage RHph_I3_18]|nr:HNH endonuclease protein [Rhizobium phage RHph_I3_18]